MVTALLLLLAAPVDFVYFDRLPEAEATFSLHGACQAGVSVFPSVGLILERVEANGRPIEPQRSPPGMAADVYTVTVQPGPSFFYHVPLKRLEYETDGLTVSVYYPLPAMPRRLAITYRVRCADGSTSPPYVTRGARLPVPR